MKFGFYVSNNATRLINTITYLSMDKELSKLLNDFTFIYRDNESNDLLVELCMEKNITLYQKELKAISKSERGLVVANDLLTLLESMQVDYLFVFGTRLLRGNLLNVYKNKIINFHPSLLPSFPGLKAIDQALEYGSLFTGNTAHFIDEGVDTGPILMQNISVINTTPDYEEVLNKQIFMLIQIILWLNDERIIVNGRRVIIKGANYRVDDFIPCIEFLYNRKNSAKEFLGNYKAENQLEVNR